MGEQITPFLQVLQGKHIKLLPWKTMTTKIKPEQAQPKLENYIPPSGISFIPEVLKDIINLRGRNPVSSLHGCLLQEMPELVSGEMLHWVPQVPGSL